MPNLNPPSRQPKPALSDSILRFACLDLVLMCDCLVVAVIVDEANDVDDSKGKSLPLIVIVI